MRKDLTRRNILPLMGAGLLTGFAGIEVWKPEKPKRQPVVGIYRSGSVLEMIQNGASDCGLKVAGQRVLIKAHLEEFDGSNTDAVVLAAVVSTLRAMGAAQVLVGAGPAKHRDTRALAEAAGYDRAVPDFGKVFVDLNRDDVSPVEGFLRQTTYFPNSALRADLVISLAKMRAGALAMENLSGLIPGSVYGWPKQIGHDDHELVALARLFQRSFAIVEGGGTVVMSESLFTADTACCQLLGLDAARIPHLQLAAETLGQTV